ncbi:ankyrin repeat protein [Achlya hypogyna]|uniref:Ankyrin repeat protein n=1 Tax=Achlya hypogyna TaxID=1202772 RepID=A0A1V9Z3L3_ACHHY|nr:ankyrin repeat protein [Achlya hypogyna]
MELIEAVKAGRSDLSALLSKVNETDEHGTTALMVAVQLDNLPAVEQLLAANCDVNRRNRDGQTALFFASSVKVAELLVAKKININSRDHQRTTAALRAIESGFEDVAIYLIERNCDVNERTKALKTMLTAAIAKSSVAILTALAKRRDLDLAAHALSTGPPMLFAAMAGDTSVASYLLGLGCDIDAQGADGTTPLMASIQNGHRALSTVLVESGCDLDIRDKTGKSAFDYALVSDPPTAITLVENGYDVRQQSKLGQTALSAALKHNQVDVAKLVVEKMISQEVDVNAKDNNGATALWPAIMATDATVVASLLAQGCDPNVEAKDGTTPLVLAIEHGKHDIVELLIQHGAGNTALLNAAAAGNKAAVLALLAYECDIDAQDADGNTPLMRALRHRHEEVAVALVERHCRTDIRNAKGESATYLALSDEHVLDLLLADTTSLDHQDEAGKTVLMVALERHAAEGIVNKLVAAASPASLALCDATHKTALFYAIEARRSAIAIKLLALGANANVQASSTGETVLMAALRHDVSLVPHLLERGADVRVPDHNGVTPLLVACAASSIPSGVVEALLAKHSDVNVHATSFHVSALSELSPSAVQEGMSPLMLALSAGRPDIAELLLAKPECDVKHCATNGQSALFLATTAPMVKTIVARGGDVNARDLHGLTPLLHSFNCADDAVALALIDLGCEVSAVGTVRGETALTRAVGSASGAVVKLLMERGCDINARDGSANGNTPLMTALENDRGDTAAQLLAHNCDATLVNDLGRSALFVATVETVATLLERGCDVNHQDKEGNTPVMHLLACNRPAVAELLIAKKCDLLRRNKRRQTALWHVASVVPYDVAVAVAKKLLHDGIDKNNEDIEGDTALIHALRHGNRDLAKLFIDERADVTKANNANETALRFVLDDPGLVKSLIEDMSEADAKRVINLRTHHDKKTLLMLALEKKLMETAKELILHQCDLQPADSEGATAVFYIIRKQAPALLDLIFEKELDCDLNAQLHDGYTPLMMAIKLELADFADRLIRHRCDVSLQNHQGGTALTMIDESGSAELLQLRGLLDTTDLFFGDTVEFRVSAGKGADEAIDIPLCFLPWANGKLVASDATSTSQPLQHVLVLPAADMLQSNNTRDAFIPARFIIKPRGEDKSVKEQKTVLKYQYPFVLEIAPETVAVTHPGSQYPYSLNAKTPGSNDVLSIQPRFLRRENNTNVPAKGEMHVCVTKPRHSSTAPVRNGDDGLAVHVVDANRLRNWCNEDWVTLPPMKRADGVVASAVCYDVAANIFGFGGRSKATTARFSLQKVDV